MTPINLLQIVAEVCTRLELPYFVTGSVAAGLFSEPRLTNDVDIVVDLNPHNVAEFCNQFDPEIYYVSVDAARQAVTSHSQFNILHPDSGFKIDIMIPEESAYSRNRFARARAVKLVSGIVVMASTPEDVILKKLEYWREGGSEKHVRDIASLLRVGGKDIDRYYLDQWALRLGLQETWEEMKRRTQPP
jgi:hypothetical protein